MARLVLSLILFTSFSLKAQIFDFTEEDPGLSKIPFLIEKLRSLEMKAEPGYEESFNQAVKDIEDGIEEEKLYCAGEAPDAEGKTVPKEKKQLCIRELKKHYLKAMDAVHELKRKYLSLLHRRQIEQLEEVHKKLKTDIEKNF